ncbi:ankyrin repeat-containing domain protein [Fusarium flagelliforme]|uniref:ankyrin repeat-containing domain protein n=1 Tax=Fusarium flagelliforme TaxID=2675880 RepID=UPI001E8E5528|nr:ankyrin repeat-containing domain protein [Fusarium flagelliforme]KAH7186154.1 ankyrin repeat-containing domain protein [Fusarium flagelliforme]
MLRLEIINTVSIAITHAEILLTQLPIGTIEEDINNCRNALFVSHPDIDKKALASAKGKRADGTCQWILHEPHYQSWLAKRFSVLRISGGPGKGKTVLSLFLAEQLRALCEGTGDRLLFFFCRFQDDRYNNPRNVLRSLAYQLLEFSHDGLQIKEVLKYFETTEMTEDVLSNFQGLWGVLETLLSQPSLPTIWCIIDGIDECHSSAMLAGSLYEHCRRRERINDQSKFQLLVLGRDIDDSDASNVIRLDTDHRSPVKSDVEHFIKSSLEPLNKVPRFAEIRARITDILVENAEGSFLWVSFVIAELSKKETCVQIIDTTIAFPKGLSATFTRMLHGIDPEYRQASASILKWILFAERPLTLAELAAATTRTAGGRYSKADAEVTADIVHMLRPFLQVRRGQVFLVHQSAEDYLMGIHDGLNTPLNGYNFVPDRCHGIIAHRCLEMLKENCSDYSYTSDTSDTDHTDHPSRPPLFGYATNYWDYHTRLSATCQDDINRAFFENMVLQQAHIYLPGANPIHPSLHQASELGIVPFVEASKRGQLTAIRLLLKHGVTSRPGIKENTYNETLLESGVEQGNERIVQLLLDRGAYDGSLGESQNKNVLCTAASKGYLGVLQLLLDYGADIESKDAYGQTALFAAASEGHLPIVECLLRCRAKIEATSLNGETPLIRAAKGQHIRTVRHLLHHGANTEARKQRGMNALMIAMKYRDFALAQTLLDYGADINAVDDLNETALVQRIVRGDEESLGYLLDHGASTKEVARSKRPLVLIATEHQSERILSFLLENDADINGKGPTGVTPLISALVRCGHLTIVRILLRYGADTGIQDGFGMTALMWARRKGYVEIEAVLRAHDEGRVQAFV